jgi:hypothetical protein
MRRAVADASAAWVYHGQAGEEESSELHTHAVQGGGKRGCLPYTHAMHPGMHTLTNECINSPLLLLPRKTCSLPKPRHRFFHLLRCLENSTKPLNQAPHVFRLPIELACLEEASTGGQGGAPITLDSLHSQLADLAMGLRIASCFLSHSPAPNLVILGPPTWNYRPGSLFR